MYICFADAIQAIVLQWIPCNLMGADFVTVKCRSHGPSMASTVVSPVATVDSEEQDSVSQPAMETKQLFACPEDGCVKSYMTHSRLEKHLIYGKHVFILEKMSLIDNAKMSYAQHLEAGAKSNVSMATKTPLEQSHFPKVSVGWALRDTTKRRTRFNEKQNKYIEKKFRDGEKSGRKSNAEDVAKEMRCVKGNDGQRIFKVDEFLRPQQISSFSVKTEDHFVEDSQHSDC